MNLQEYQAKEILASFGIPVPKGDIAANPETAKTIAEQLGGKVVVKAQVQMGGRGKAGGVKLANSTDEAYSAAQSILGKRLISPQNQRGLIAEIVLIAEQVTIKHEYYLAVTLDRANRRNALIISAKGGMDIEETARVEPSAIKKVPIYPDYGIFDFEVKKALTELNIDPKLHGQFTNIAKRLVKAYNDKDASLIEINPLVLTDEGKLLAVDAKVGIDENALYRQDAFSALKESSADDPIEAEAQRLGIAYVRLNGDIGVIGNGAGLVMCTLDEVSRAGGKAANFLDIGGGATSDRVKQSVELVLMDSNVKGLLFNIFGGITRGDEVAKGILSAFNEMDLKIPVVIRIEGTNADAGRKILEGSKLVPAETMQSAAQKICALIGQ